MSMNALPKPLSTVDLVDDIHIRLQTGISLLALIGLIGGSIGYEGHREVALNVIERELHAAADSMSALTEKLHDCLED
jgi:hypothetical protein